MSLGAVGKFLAQRASQPLLVEVVALAEATATHVALAPGLDDLGCVWTGPAALAGVFRVYARSWHPPLTECLPSATHQSDGDGRALPAPVSAVMVQTR